MRVVIKSVRLVARTVCCVAGLWAGLVHADGIETYKQIGQVIFVADGTVRVTVVNPGPSNECFWTVINIPANAATRKEWIAALLTAKGTGLPASITYTGTSVSCTVTELNVGS